MKLIQFGIREDYGKEYYMTILTTKKYSLLQVSFDVGEYGNWIEFPYLQITMGYGKLFSFLLSIGKLGFTFDIAGRNWRDELFYASRDYMELKDEPEHYDEVEWDEKDNSKPMDEVVNRLVEKWKTNPPEFLKFELGKTLEELITRWWCDVFTTHEDWDMETVIDDLIDQIQLWLPREQSHEGTQDVSVIDLVDGYNDCLTKIKSKLRNKR